MSRQTRPLVICGIVVLLLAGATGSVVGAVGSNAAARTTASEVVTRAALAFRSDGGSGFEARLPGYGVAVSAGGATVSSAGGSQPLRLRLDGARPDAVAAGRAPLSGRVNLFLGDDPSQWRTDVATYGQAAFSGVWDGIDVVWYGKGPHLEQDFVVAPGADPDRIAISFPDGRDLSVTDGGDLVVQLPTGRARLGAPTVYQTVDGQQRQVAGSYVIREGGQVGFRIGPHDPAVPLVIDPVLLESTFVGGGGNDAAYGVAVDPDGSIYVSGSTESPDFPVIAPIQAALVQSDAPRSDAFVARINPDGSGFAYSTFLGGGARDIAYGVAVGGDGSAYVAGSTESTDFPLARPIQNVYGGGGTDAFLSKLSPQGVVLQYSTYLGGAGADGARGIAADLAGNAYVTGTTTSNNFPTAGGPPLQPTPNRPDDTAGFVTKANPAGDAWVYSTYLGGSGDDHGTAIAVSATGEAFVVGDTRSPDFPVVRGFQPRTGAPPGPTTPTADAFVVKLPAAGNPAVYATYLGGFEADMATGVDLDASGAAYVTGSTGSSNFPLMEAVQINRRGEYDAFVSKINPAGSGLVYSTFLGGSDSDAGAAITVADDNSASVTGSVASGDFPTVKPFQAAKAGGFIDGFVASYTPSGSGVTQASYLGGRDDDQGTAITSRGADTLYVAGYTSSPDFPLVSPLRPAQGGAGDAFVASVGEPPPGAATGTPGAPARERRLRIFGAITAILFLGAIAQTLWLRRRPAQDEPAPVPVGTPAVARDHQWYKQPAPRFSDLPPLRPRAVPSPTSTSGRSKSAPPDAAADGDVAVPDLLPADVEQEWTRGVAPADAESLMAKDGAWDEAAATGSAAPLPSVDVRAPDLWGPTDAEESVAVDPGPPAPTSGAGATPPLAVDMQAPDLWDATESPSDDLADDPMWAELMAAEAPGAGKAEPARTEPAKVEAGKPDRAKAEPAKVESDKADPATAEVAKADVAKAEPTKAEPTKAEVATAGPAPAESAAPVPEPTQAAPAPPSRRRRRKAAAPDEPVPAVTGTAAADEDWMAELWLDRPEDRPAPAADETRSDVDDAPVPAQAATVDAIAGVAPDHPSEPAAPETERKTRGWRARRRAAAGERDGDGGGQGSPSADAADVGLDTAEVLAAPPPPVAPRRSETTAAAAAPPTLVPGTQPATARPAGTGPEAASPPLAPPPAAAAAKARTGKRSAAEKAAAAPPAAAPPPTAAAPPGAPPRSTKPPAEPLSPEAPAAKAAASAPPPPKAAAARPPRRRPTATKTGAPRRPASRPTLPPPTDPVPTAPGVRVLPPAGDPFAPAPMRASTEAPTGAPGGSPPETSRRRTARRSDAPDWRRSAAEAKPPPPPAPPAPPAPPVPAVPDMERDVVEAGLADLVGNVETVDLPGDALVGELSIGDLFAEEPSVPDADGGDDDGSDSEPPGEAPPPYRALPEAAPGRWQDPRTGRE